jgi:hypothetical protein
MNGTASKPEPRLRILCRGSFPSAPSAARPGEGEGKRSGVKDGGQRSCDLILWRNRSQAGYSTPKVTEPAWVQDHGTAHRPASAIVRVRQASSMRSIPSCGAVLRLLFAINHSEMFYHSHKPPLHHPVSLLCNSPSPMKPRSADLGLEGGTASRKTHIQAASGSAATLPRRFP